MKNQSGIEQNFGFLKDPVIVNSIFLKKPKRIDVLGLILVIARKTIKWGAESKFQVISQRYEQGALVITSNRAFKDWPEIFNNDSTLTAAILDRLLHHAETIKRRYEAPHSKAGYGVF